MYVYMGELKKRSQTLKKERHPLKNLGDNIDNNMEEQTIRLAKKFFWDFL